MSFHSRMINYYPLMFACSITTMLTPMRGGCRLAHIRGVIYWMLLGVSCFPSSLLFCLGLLWREGRGNSPLQGILIIYVASLVTRVIFLFWLEINSSLDKGSVKSFTLFGFRGVKPHITDSLPGGIISSLATPDSRGV